MDVDEQHAIPTTTALVGHQTVLGHGAVARLSFVLAALAVLWLAIAAVLGWLR
jgi:hypothetical protein